MSDSQIVSLADVCDYAKARGVSDCYIGTEDMLQNFEGVCFSNKKQQKGILFQAGDTLMSNIRPYLKKAWFADRSGTASADVLVFRPKENIDPLYLHYLIARQEFADYAMVGAKGLKMPRGDKDHLMEYEFELPELNEQQRIASLFKLLDAKILAVDDKLKTLKNIKKGLMQRIFV